MEPLLLRVKKLEGAARVNVNGEEIPFMEVGMIVDWNPFIGDGKIIWRNTSKNGIKEKNGTKRARVGYGDMVCYHFQKSGHIQYTCNKLKKDLRSLKLLKEMKKATMEVSNRENLKGKKTEVPIEKVRKATTLKKGVVEKSELPNIDEGLVKKAKSDVEDGHVLLAKCDDNAD